MQKPILPNRYSDQRMCVYYLTLFLAISTSSSKMKADSFNSFPKSAYKVLY